MRLIAGAFTLALLTISVGAQTSRLGDVVARLDGYLQGYEDRLANVVAEETKASDSATLAGNTGVVPQPPAPRSSGLGGFLALSRQPGLPCTRSAPADVEEL